MKNMATALMITGFILSMVGMIALIFAIKKKDESPPPVIEKPKPPPYEPFNDPDFDFIMLALTEPITTKEQDQKRRIQFEYIKDTTNGCHIIYFVSDGKRTYMLKQPASLNKIYNMMIAKYFIRYVVDDLASSVHLLSPILWDDPYLIKGRQPYFGQPAYTGKP